MKYPIKTIPPENVKISGHLTSGATDKFLFKNAGISFEIKCPDCGNSINEFPEYVKYVPYGQPFQVRVWCDNCAEPDGVINKNYNGHFIKLQLTVTVSTI